VQITRKPKKQGKSRNRKKRRKKSVMCMYIANNAVFKSLPENMELFSPGTTEKKHIAVVIHSTYA
jgi:hypothetical protein